MAITSARIGNFKGIKTPCDLEIRPITVFVGPNSSGKSSCIHALAALSQTVKITNNSRPLVLDDEFASVHLGRFIEIVHSKSYDDAIELGIRFKDLRYRVMPKKDDDRGEEKTDDASAILRFKSTMRTQETYLESAVWQIGDQTYDVKRRKGDTYTVTKPGTKWKEDDERASAFTLERIVSPRISIQHYFEGQPFHAAQGRATQELTRTLYLGPFRQNPQRRYPTRGGGPTEVGALGEATVTMLANEMVQSRSRTHIKQVTQWLAHLKLAKSLDVTRVGTSDLFDVTMTLEDGKKFPLVDLGYGLSQILPVLTQCSFAPRNSTLLFEQPEIHLHSIVARPLSEVFVETAREKNVHIVIETHSPDLVKGFMVLRRQGKLPARDLIIYRVVREGGESVVTPIEIADDHEVYENWEKGISLE